MSIRFNCEIQGFEQAEQQVTARLRDRKSGRESVVRSEFLVGADGSRNGVREATAWQKQSTSVARIGWGEPASGKGDQFRKAIDTEVTPAFRRLPGVLAFRVLWPEKADDGAAAIACQFLVEFADGTTLR